MSPSLSPSPAPAPDIIFPTPTEIFVDASAWGIGFCMNGQWLAWRLKPGWNSFASGRDITWSEMVAVELGLRVLISAGFHSSDLTVRSDNMGVVQALETRKWDHEPQGKILCNVLRLAEEYGVEMNPLWIPSECNPADGYSRGVAGPKAMMFPKVPTIPPHLEDFVVLATDVEGAELQDDIFGL